VYFRQQRIGRDGKPFDLLKFATMLKDSPHIGTGTVTIKDDPRVLPFGRLLRKTKINELPQLINIFLGDMSLVGPRPQTRRCFDAFPLSTREVIVQVRPGLSGIGSILFRDEESMLHGRVDPMRFYDDVIAPYKGALEEWYVLHQGPRVYLLSIAMTAWVLVFPNSGFAWRAFPGLPKPPTELASMLGYPMDATA
jgi:lipopolysaccharide/colanic/teichoic acid biosynthesis glycosyltransferase